MRLVDADKLKEVFTLPKEYTDKKDESFYHVSFPIIRATIDDAPTVDAVEVVRCKDCKYLIIINEEKVYAVCKKHGKVFHLWAEGEDTREHYCSWAERKENETD